MERNFERILKDQQKQIAHGENLEQIIGNLKEEGVTILDAVKLVKKLFRLPLSDAQSAVLQHPLWANEARSVLSFSEMVLDDISYSNWIEWFCLGTQQLPVARFVLNDGSHPVEEVIEQLEVAIHADDEKQQQILQDLISHPNEVLEACITVVSVYQKYEKALVELALRAISAIGYPANVATIRWLVNLAAHENAPGRAEAIHILRDMDRDAVVPYFLAALINDSNHTEQSWYITNGICKVILEQETWSKACGPAVAALIAQEGKQQHYMLDFALLLAILERIHPHEVYAIPAIYMLAVQRKDSNVGRQAIRLLHSFTDEVLKPYSYHLKWLAEG